MLMMSSPGWIISRGYHAIGDLKGSQEVAWVDLSVRMTDM